MAIVKLGGRWRHAVTQRQLANGRCSATGKPRRGLDVTSNCKNVTHQQLCALLLKVNAGLDAIDESDAINEAERQALSVQHLLNTIQRLHRSQALRHAGIRLAAFVDRGNELPTSAARFRPSIPDSA